MPNPTKPTINLTREERIDQSPKEEHDDLAVNNTMRLLGFTWDDERQWWFNQDNVWLYQGAARNLVQSIDTYTQAKEREARIEGRILENKFYRHGLFNQDLSQPPYVDLPMFRRHTDELEVEKENL